jgi:uncharacterized protein YyaL (SSP411 family)
LDRARREERPIFLSIGYSACHWCHVMEHESFESPEIAAKMNELFVCIKVDREERPDLDQIYMHAVQLMTGRGGWPMSVFLTPELQPFFGGTYWPPRARMGMPGFDLVLERVAEAWRDKRDAACEQAAQLTDLLASAGAVEGETGDVGLDALFAAEAKLERSFDFTHGGFGGAPKFPHSMDLQFLLRMNKRRPRAAVQQMIALTLDKMAAGGMYDHLGGGFARYSVDDRWLIPHFEKMLYDNALLTTAYIEAYQATGESRFAQVASETCDYILRDMLDPAGGFHSAEDADSEGEEGKFYAWTPEQIAAVLGPQRAERFCYVYDVSMQGNFEHGQSVLNLPKTLSQCASLRGWDEAELAADMQACKQELLQVRSGRVRPGKDDKVICSWNALMIDALARVGAALGEAMYLAAAERAATFLLTTFRKDADGRLFHVWRQGTAKGDAFLDDYAYLAQALVTLYETTGKESYVAAAVQLAEIMLRHFADPAGGGLFYVADDHERLIARTKDFYDSSIPSSNGMAATVLLRLAKLTGRHEFHEQAAEIVRTSLPIIVRSPSASGQLLIAADFLLGPAPEIVVLGDVQRSPAAELLAEFQRQFIPNRVLAYRPAPTATGSPVDPLFAGKTADPAEVAVYVCQNFACLAPVTGAENVRALWQRLVHER